jgi:hypothetical protein
MKRLAIGFFTGFCVSVGLFYLMSALIKTMASSRGRLKRLPRLNFLRQIKDSQTDVRQRNKPKPPPEAEPQPEMPKMQITDNNDVKKPDLQMDMPELPSTISKGNGLIWVVLVVGEVTPQLCPWFELNLSTQEELQ